MSAPQGAGPSAVVFAAGRRDAYRRYAEALLDDRAAARAATDAVLDAVLARWRDFAAEESPAAQAWAVLRDAVAMLGGRPPHAASPHCQLPQEAADAAVLHYGLGLRLTEVGELMGISSSKAAAHVLAAERSMPYLGTDRPGAAR